MAGPSQGASLAAAEGGPDPDRVARFADWLSREGRFLPDNAELMTQFCERVAASGVPLARCAVHLRTLHPQYGGVTRFWRRGAPIEERFLDHGIEKTLTYTDSPVHAVVEGRRRLSWRLDGADALPFPVLEEFRAEGYVEYAIAPLVYSDGAVNAISWATDRKEGFSAADLAFFDAILPAFAGTVELKALRRFTSNLLRTYVGREPGQLILSGQIRRGDVRAITAALMLIDLRDFTSLSDTLSPRAVIRMLNAYFDCVMPPMRRHDGEIMEIMGDAVLAIFRDGPENTRKAACELALAAASEGLAALAAANAKRHPGLPKLHAGVALHYGTVSYGNIGAEDRLDFTVIGPDVNLTSRIERLCRELDRSLIMSEAFATSLDRPIFAIGHFELRGFVRMQRLFELPPATG